MKIVGVIPARMENTRLPGKVLMDLCGMSMLERVVARACGMAALDSIFVIFPYGDHNEIIRDVCVERKWPYLQGDRYILGDLLSEFRNAALATNADVIVRIDSDDPFVDPLLAAETLSTLVNGSYDYVSSKAENSGFPVGVGVEVFTKEALLRAHEMTITPECFTEKSLEIRGYLRNVTPFIYKHPEIFKIHNMEVGCGDFSHIRLTVDTPNDLELARTIYHYLVVRFLAWGRSFSWRNVIRFLEDRPDLLEINSHVQQEYIR